MFLKTLDIEGYRQFGKPLHVEFAKGLNVLVGENGSGKSAIIDTGKYEVTQAEYLEVIGTNPSYWRNGVEGVGSGGPVTHELQHPVEMVSWFDATNYCALHSVPLRWIWMILHLRGHSVI